MILRIEDIKDVCSKVLWAIDSNDVSECRGLVRLYTNDNNLYLAVSSLEYSMLTKIPYDGNEKFEAVIDANVFLKLIAQITTDTIELNTTDKILHIKGNGTYKIPMIFDGDKLMQFPSIDLINVVNEFVVPNDVFKKIFTYNAKQLNLCNGGREIFNYYYFDNHGCITANLGACITNFELNTPVKLLFNQRLVRLFKLFGADDVVMSIAKDTLNENIIQTKVCFSSNDIVIKSILSCDDTFVDTYPVSNVRSLADADFDYSVIFKRNQLVETLNRLNLFVTNPKIEECVKFNFLNKGITISDSNDVNSELIYYQNDININENEYVAFVDLKMIKTILESITTPFITIKFGNHRAFVIEYDEVKSIVPESTCQ